MVLIISVLINLKNYLQNYLKKINNFYYNRKKIKNKELVYDVRLQIF